MLGAYRSYWRAALQESRREAATRRLFEQLRRALGLPGRPDRDAVLAALGERLDALGVHSVTGTTPPLYELMLYLKEDDRKFEVALPDGHRETVSVLLMRDMVSYGWARFLTCGGTGTGGFAADNSLYAVADKYDLDTESFRVNFLAHETQHFADYKRLPGLEPPDLELRAKLVELAQADATLRETLAAFLANQGDDRALPHTWANRRSLLSVAARLQLASPADLLDAAPERVREAASAVLVQDNAERGLPVYR